MRKIVMLSLILILLIRISYAQIDNCAVYECDNSSWQEVYSNYCEINGWSDEMWCSTGSFTPTDSSKCYKFNIEAGTVAVNIRVEDPPQNTGGKDCDSHAWGGYRDQNINTDIWFENLSGYLGYVGETKFDYKLEGMYSSAEANADTNYINNAIRPYNIYCAPNGQACDQLGGYRDVCDTNCYGHSTIGYFYQGYEKEYYPDMGKINLFYNAGCGDSNMVGQSMYNNYLRVYETDLKCATPTASNVKIVPPIYPNAGNDLICNFTYNDPKNFSEQNSSYEWWKNGVNQNINNKVLGKGNLTPLDEWYCKVTPSNGLIFGKTMQSNTIYIEYVPKNPKMYVGNNLVWEKEGYFSDSENIYNFESYLQNELDNCVPDAEGNCEITINFSSDIRWGDFYLSFLRIYYDAFDIDNDGYGIPEDCDDNNPNIHPGASETCNNIDDNCNDQIDELFDVGDICLVGVGVCERHGNKICSQDGQSTVCNAISGDPTGNDNNCNGFDENCNGISDENYVTDNTCGVGYCRDTNTPSSCNNSIETQCQPGNQRAEDCNGIDDDCNGWVDDNLANPPLCELQQGVCSGASKSCDNGNWAACSLNEYGNNYEAAETKCSDNLDNDCDGLTDANDPNCHICTSGETRDCNTGQQGICTDGTETCINGFWGNCIRDNEPANEICNAKDDDCDGSTDEDYIPQTCGQGVCIRNSVCQNGQEICTPGNPTGQDNDCNAFDEDCDGTSNEHYVPINDCGVGYCRDTNTPSSCNNGIETQCQPGTQREEDCNNIDDDCDTWIDNNLANPPLCELQQGVCSGATKSCDSGNWAACSLNEYGNNYEATETKCSDNLDNDCDGLADANDPNCHVCASGETRDCNTGQQGICADGTETCINGFWGNCIRDNEPTDEICNAKDDDCDGTTDEDYIPQTCGLGVCIRNSVCQNGQEVCTPGNPTGLDNDCNAFDEDCDGSSDEHYVIDNTCGIGYCRDRNTPSSCNNGVETQCQPGLGRAEDCNNIDDDCDTWIDNNLANPPLCELQQGVCSGATKSCDSGNWAACSLNEYGNNYEATETKCSDNLDNDCDGLADANDPDCYECAQGNTRSCDTGELGICIDGTQTCSANGNWGSCIRNNNPIDEICNGLDDDCDGNVDEDDICCGNGRLDPGEQCEPRNTTLSSCTSYGESYLQDFCNYLCQFEDFNCEADYPDCTADEECDELRPNTGECDSQCRYFGCRPATEVCNGLDDDCDGLIDEDLGTTTCGVGQCQRTVDNCINGQLQQCIPGLPVAEICNNNLDDDCDGLVDMNDPNCACDVAFRTNAVDGNYKDGTWIAVKINNSMKGYGFFASYKRRFSGLNPRNYKLLGKTPEGYDITTYDSVYSYLIIWAPIKYYLYFDNDPDAKKAVLSPNPTEPYSSNGQEISNCDTLCGNNIVETGEECDNGANNGVLCIPPYNGQCSYCSSVCKNIVLGGGSCGDSLRNGPEECDDGNINNNDACKNDCANNICGDNVLYIGVEQCDDGNTANGDGCDSNCRRELICIDNDNDGYWFYNCPNGDDCDDSNWLIHPRAAEICNAKDDDCDGKVDEGLGSTTCGVGACRRTVDNCVNGQLQQCTPGAPTAEICNSIDDNCNGLTDESLTRQCGQTDVGECSYGTETCVAGIYAGCNTVFPVAEVCDTKDNDCDGSADESNICGCIVEFRTNAVNGDYKSGTWIAVDGNNDNLLEGYGYKKRLYSPAYYCNDQQSALIAHTPEGYEVRKYSTMAMYVCRPTDLFYYYLGYGNARYAELSTEPKELYTSNGQEVCI